ncbi:dihydroorotate dehydrogenase (quinone) [Pseudonocardia sp. TMWB2A]|uniref:quinone-dependent dihydroorotate dehydrogenase n=1 Tax=Pseudonocardia sp. TMWB2A TaxID=687430 RepID=UPI00307E4D0A
MLYSLAKPVLFGLDAENAHSLTIKALKLRHRARPLAADPMLAMAVAGLHFPNPVGLAPGFDKNAEVIHAMPALGFGFAEVGTLTPRAQSGNDRPRLFRLVEDRAVINRMGFNNDGQEAAAARIKALRSSGPVPLIGINIGANKDSTAEGRAAQDYVRGVEHMAALADYLTVNISSPNTPGLRALQDKGALDALLAAVMAARGNDAPPVFLKVAPDLEPADIDDIIALAHQHRLDALIVSNTTISRPADLRSSHAQQAGGLSGAPLCALSRQRLKDFVAAGSGTIPLVSVGGIASAEEAYARIRAGASLVQIYSAMVYEGPMLASRINRGLKRLLERDGFARLADAVGA